MCCGVICRTPPTLNNSTMREIKRYSSAGRMILTGTPLQVKQPFRIWSLPNFILPVMNDLDAFHERCVASLTCTILQCPCF
ncbi:hypothetical protein EDD15DRAFT_2250103 [Pisolithus albus]|nr:hypothetical protein EDD15DRAFT_2250103 [Pisolithus albus]